MNNVTVDVRRLELLVALSRLGSMRAVADVHHLTTSTVSQQLAALAREAGAALTEPDGRRVRLTPAGRRLAEHAVTILAAVDTARLALDPDAEPVGTVRIGGFATGIRVSLLPAMTELSNTAPGIDVIISEFEPDEASELLLDDRLDLALTYDYNLVPMTLDPMLQAQPLWCTPWGLAVPDDGAALPDEIAIADLKRYADQSWIVNSRNVADEEAVRILAALAGFTPRVTHQIDSLDLVDDLILAGYGVGLLPLARHRRDGLRVLALREPGIVLTAYAVTRRGRPSWPPLQSVLRQLGGSGSQGGLAEWPRTTAVNVTPPG